MTEQYKEFALPEYLVFLILAHIKELRQVAPDHILVKAVEQALREVEDDPHAPLQLELPLRGALS